MAAPHFFRWPRCAEHDIAGSRRGQRFTRSISAVAGRVQSPVEPSTERALPFSLGFRQVEVNADRIETREQSQRSGETVTERQSRLDSKAHDRHRRNSGRCELEGFVRRASARRKTRELGACSEPSPCEKTRGGEVQVEPQSALDAHGRPLDADLGSDELLGEIVLPFHPDGRASFRAFGDPCESEAGSVNE